MISKIIYLFTFFKIFFNFFLFIYLLNSQIFSEIMVAVKTELFKKQARIWCLCLEMKNKINK